MEKIFNNQGELTRRLDSKTGRFFIEVPDFYKDENGNYVIADELIKINSKKAFEEYIAKHQEIIAFLGDNYPKLVSTVYKNTMTSFTDPYKRTVYSKLLSGKSVKNTEIYQEAHATDIRSIFSGYIKTYNAQNMGLEGASVPLPLVKRTSKQFLKLFMDEKQGYLVPEIDENGLVVNATSSRDDLSVKLIAVPSKDVTEEQFFEYLSAPFGDKINEYDIDLNLIKRLCGEAYKNLGQSEMTESIENIVDYCMSVYPLSFARIKADRTPGLEEPPVVITPEEEPPVVITPDEEPPVVITPEEELPVIIPPVEEPPVDEYEEQFKVIVAKVPNSRIRDSKGEFKYFSRINSVTTEREVVKKERE